MAAPYAHRNRRSGDRVYLRTRVACMARAGDAYDGAVGNLGEGGLFVHAPAPYGAGTRLELAFRLSTPTAVRTLRARGEVVWVRRAGAGRLHGFGVRFTEIEAGEAGVIEGLLGRRLEERRALGFA